MLGILTSVVHYRVFVYLVVGTGELAMYLTVYCDFVDERSRVYGFDRGCEGGDLTFKA